VFRAGSAPDREWPRAIRLARSGNVEPQPYHAEPSPSEARWTAGAALQIRIPQRTELIRDISSGQHPADRKTARCVSGCDWRAVRSAGRVGAKGLVFLLGSSTADDQCWAGCALGAWKREFTRAREQMRFAWVLVWCGPPPMA